MRQYVIFPRFVILADALLFIVQNLNKFYRNEFLDDKSRAAFKNRSPQVDSTKTVKSVEKQKKHLTYIKEWNKIFLPNIKSTAILIFIVSILVVHP